MVCNSLLAQWLHRALVLFIVTLRLKPTYKCYVQFLISAQGRSTGEADISNILRTECLQEWISVSAQRSRVFGVLE